MREQRDDEQFLGLLFGCELILKTTDKEKAKNAETHLEYLNESARLLNEIKTKSDLLG